MTREDGSQVEMDVPFSIGKKVEIDYEEASGGDSVREDSQSEIRSLRKRQEVVAGRSDSPDEAERFRSEAESLVSWAKDKGKLIDKQKWVERVGQWGELDRGLEHEVFRDFDSNRVVKLTKPFNYGAHGQRV